jgi:hypothetical protein
MPASLAAVNATRQVVWQCHNSWRVTAPKTNKISLASPCCPGTFAESSSFFLLVIPFRLILIDLFASYFGCFFLVA